MEKILNDIGKGLGDLINTFLIEPAASLIGGAVEGTASAVGAAVVGGGRMVMDGAEALTERAANLTANIGQVRGDESVSNHQFAAIVPAGMNVGISGQEHSAGDDFIGHNLQTGQQRTGQEFFMSA